jgi:hypothetical protein
MSTTDDHDLPMEEYRRAGLEITRGNPEVYKSDAPPRRPDHFDAPGGIGDPELKGSRSRSRERMLALYRGDWI